MDILDVKILREFAHDRQGYPFQSDVRKSFRAVARELDVDEGTARSRMKKLRVSGFVKAWWVFPNPRLFRLRVADCRFVVRPESLKDDVMSKIRLIQGVWFMINHLGDSMRVAFCFEDDQSLRNQLELIARISNSEATFHREIHFPSCTIVPSRCDWKIIKSIQMDPTKTYDDILKGTSLSYVTVKKRLSRMIEERALFTIPSIEPKALVGGLMADLLISFERSESKQEAYRNIVSHLNECFLSAELGDAEHMTFSILITSVSQIREIVDWMRRQDGIKSVHLDLVEERIELYDTFTRQVEKKLEQG